MKYITMISIENNKKAIDRLRGHFQLVVENERGLFQHLARWNPLAPSLAAAPPLHPRSWVPELQSGFDLPLIIALYLLCLLS